MASPKVEEKNNEIIKSNEYVQSSRLKTLNERKNYLLRLSIIPIVVCFIAFTRATIYRLILIPKECLGFGWYSSSSAEFSCDHRPLDFHAVLAVIWLLTFTFQTLSLMGNFNWFHRKLGSIGYPLAAFNVLAMLYLSMYDLLYPMEKTDRPKIFSIFMFLTAVKIGSALRNAYIAIQNKQIDDHMIWMFRSFITSFTTPVIRFYPLVLRKIAGDDCFQENRELFVMGSMYVAEMSCLTMYVMAQRKTQKVFLDSFMKSQIMVAVLVGAAELYWVQNHNLFLTGMLSCAIRKYF
jgi:hypothetical protein